MHRILYRGDLKDCNYGCFYCSLPKAEPGQKAISDEQQALTRFTRWVQSAPLNPLEILFTPFGEALRHPFYPQAIAFLSRLSNVAKVVVQTNLSQNMNWLNRCERRKVALWCTFHPRQAELKPFITQCQALNDMNVRYSVGAVAVNDHIEYIRALRSKLPAPTYLWLNAYKQDASACSEEQIKRFSEIDPYFRMNTRYYPSENKQCRCGDTVFSVYSNGDVKRCHFTFEILGNIFADDIRQILNERRCPNRTCHCHIGYIHLLDSPFYAIFKDGILERIPYDGSLQP